LNILKWLENWHRSNCSNSAWENIYGIKIFTIDNPGWGVEIELSETPLEGKTFTAIVINNNESDWLDCHVNNDVFVGAGDTNKLEIILNIFKTWTIEHLTDGSLFNG